jgi:hypothetical protein
MKRYFVITHHSQHNGHLNVQDLLPASCKLITGVAVIATVKQAGEMEDTTELLVFPKALIRDLLKKESIIDLFYSYLRTRSSEAESKDYFESSLLPEITHVLTENIKYTCLDEDEQIELSENLNQLFLNEFADYLYNDAGLYEKGKNMDNQEFADYIAQQTLIFAYLKKEETFLRTKQVYKQPEPYECGNISLLINGNSFLLRDYVLTANRKLRNLQKEIIPFHEPLEVNSNIHTVFKSNKNSDDSTLTIRIYIEYEHK